jgi:hypothetical protein
MASVIKVETLQDTDGNNAVGMQYVANGSAKSWTYIHNGASPLIVDSFNTASVTDIALAQVASNFTNNMSNDDFSATAMAQEEVFIAYIQELNSVNPRSSSRMATITHGSGQADVAGRNHTVHGDLA